MASKTEKKNNTRSRIVSYVMNNADTSKVEISKNLNMSMPTVLSNVNELMAGGVLMETGEYASTGGRKAKSIGINPGYRYAMGIRITANHVGMTLVNMRSEIEKTERVRMKFSQEISYCVELASLAKKFLGDIHSGNHQSGAASCCEVSCFADRKLQLEFSGTGFFLPCLF